MSAHHTLGPLNAPLPTSAEVMKRWSAERDLCLAVLADHPRPEDIQRITGMIVAYRESIEAATRRAVLEEVRAEMQNHPTCVNPADCVRLWLNGQLAGGDE